MDLNFSQSNSNMQGLDLLTILSFLAQIENIDKDSIETKYIHTVIQAISKEIELLHKENDLILEKLDYLIKLKEGEK